MKLIFDARWLTVDDRFDGISRYSHELAWALSNQPDLEITWLIYDKRQAAKLPEGQVIYANNPANAFAEFFTLAHKLNKLKPDVVYSPFFLTGSLGKKYKLVLTIHDLIYFTHRTPPQWLPWHTRLLWRAFYLTKLPLRAILNSADIIATVSNTARQELLDKRVTKRSIITVSNAVSGDFAQIPTDHSQSNSLVYMGSFTPYKNVECLIDALSDLPGVTLHLCSKMPLTRRKELEQRMKSRGVYDRVVIHGGVSDEQYRELLTSSRCLVTASKLEGFGLPIIEAQLLGVPVACSDTPIFREVGGDSLCYFDPNDPKKCADAINELADASASKDFVARGCANAQRFSWVNSARVAADICHQLVVAK